MAFYFSQWSPIYRQSFRLSQSIICLVHWRNKCPCAHKRYKPLSSFLPFQLLSSILSPFASQPLQKTVDCFHPPAAPAKGTKEVSMNGSDSFWPTVQFPSFHIPTLKSAKRPGNHHSSWAWGPGHTYSSPKQIDDNYNVK